MEIAEIKRRILHSIAIFYTNDADLISRNNYEPTLSAMLAHYLRVDFMDYKVDCEYDKHINGDKYLAELARNIRPDIVIHRRGVDEMNLVYMEIKKVSTKSGRVKDREKVIAMTRANGEYHYALGVFIDFAQDLQGTVISFFINGEQID